MTQVLPRPDHPLGRLLDREDQRATREMIVRSWGELESEGALPARRRVLEEEDLALRVVAARALGEVPGSAAETLLLEVLELSDDDADDALEQAS